METVNFVSLTARATYVDQKRTGTWAGMIWGVDLALAGALSGHTSYEGCSG